MAGSTLPRRRGWPICFSAETELSRAAALANVRGALSRQVEGWRGARAGALRRGRRPCSIFSDEEDSADLPECFTWNISALGRELNDWLARPRSERLGEGFRVVLAGPPNAGEIDAIQRFDRERGGDYVAHRGHHPRCDRARGRYRRRAILLLSIRQGLRDGSLSDSIEAIGNRPGEGVNLARADVVLWLGPGGRGPD